LEYYEFDHREDKKTGLNLVFVHGAGSSNLIWSIQARVFSDDHRVITFDLSGHGESPSVDEPVSIEGCFVMELAALIEHLDLHDFVLIGHSMGGGIVMAYTVNDKMRQPQAIALVDTSSDLELSRLLPGLGIEKVEEVLHHLTLKLKHEEHPSVPIIEAEIKLREENPDMLTNDLTACDAFDIEDRLHKISVPTLIIHGDNDDIIRPGFAQVLEDKIPRADVAFVKGAHHQPMIEQPERFNALLKKYLDWVTKNT
jgi:pimeloyl-ACP methyl ester carboxylesterase